LPFFSPFKRHHEWVRACPQCDAHSDLARLRGVLPATGQTVG
jgi:hypothetical protein